MELLIFIKSFLIGICAILPGVSGSVVAVSLNIYDKFLKSISNKTIFCENKKFTLLVIIGVLSGSFITSKFIVNFFCYKTIIYYSLAGIIMSEIPFLVKKIHTNNGGRVKIIPLVFSFLFSIILEITKRKAMRFNEKISYFIGGILFSFGKLFPGISSSFFLLSLGIYKDIIVLITKPYVFFLNLSKYLPFLFGAVLGFLIFYKLLIFMMDNYFEITYSMIIGFIISSVIVIIPNFEIDYSHIVGILFMIFLFTLFIFIKKKNDS